MPSGKTNDLQYPRLLIIRLRRQDLRIVSPAWLEEGLPAGMLLPGVVLDHAFRATDRQWAAYQESLVRVRPH